ncbi:MAG: apolipoprotein N-acyltransferase [Oleiphilaceae bacterium]|nr:apolipoprotein N-acyltransferase [Oleiphilaceae bacterium]
MPLNPVLLSLVAGVAFSLGNLGHGLWFVAFFCLVPLIEALSRVHQRRQAALIGLLFGAALYASGFLWLLDLGEGFFAGSQAEVIALWGMYGLWFSLLLAVCCVAIKQLLRWRLPMLLAVAAPWLLWESFQPLVFPAKLGFSLVHHEGLLQWARFGGEPLLSLLLIAGNVAIWLMLRKHYRQALVIPAVFCFVMSVLGILEVFIGEHAIEQASMPLRVGVVQGNLVELPKDERRLVSHHYYADRSKQLLVDHPDIDLFVWPESVYQLGLRTPLPLNAAMVTSGLPIPVLFGSNAITQKAGQRSYANALFLAEKQGLVQQQYAKQKLIPLAEHIPAIIHRPDWKLRIQALMPHLQHFTPGGSKQGFVLNQTRIATPICYEMIDGPLVRALVQQNNANLLVTVSNDSWFKEGDAPRMHLLLARLRAVEHGLWVVRAANSGISALINPRGEVVEHLPFNTAGELVVTPELRNTQTLYSAWGDWCVWLVLFAGVALLLVRMPMRRESTGKHSEIAVSP